MTSETHTHTHTHTGKALKMLVTQVCEVWEEGDKHDNVCVCVCVSSGRLVMGETTFNHVYGPSTTGEITRAIGQAAAGKWPVILRQGTKVAPRALRHGSLRVLHLRVHMCVCVCAPMCVYAGGVTASKLFLPNRSVIAATANAALPTAAAAARAAPHAADPADVAMDADDGDRLGGGSDAVSVAPQHAHRTPRASLAGGELTINLLADDNPTLAWNPPNLQPTTAGRCTITPSSITHTHTFTVLIPLAKV